MNEINTLKKQIKKLSSLVEDLIICEGGWRTPDEKEIMDDAKDRLYDERYKIQLKLKKQKIEEELEELEELEEDCV